MIIAGARGLGGAVARAREARVRAQGGVAAGMDAVNSIRLEWGTPWFGIDYGDKEYSP